MKKKSFLGLTSGKFLEALGSGVGTGSIFCLSFSLSNNVVAFVGGPPPYPYGETSFMDGPKVYRLEF